jgi:hypothetical protein
MGGLTVEGNQEDRRAASSLIVSLSTYVTTASLAILAVEAAIATFVLDQRTELTFFYVLAGLGAFFLVLSVYLGGRGIDELSVAGHKGRWEVRTKSGLFGWQSSLALAGLVFVLASAFTGEAKEQTPDPLVSNLEQRVASLESQVARLTNRSASLEKRVQHLARRSSGSR